MKVIKPKRWIIAALVIGLCVVIRFSGPVDYRIRCAASSAAWSGNLLKLRMIRLLGVDINEPVPGRGPLLVSAAWTGQREIIAYLLAAGADIEVKDKFGNTALAIAAHKGHIEAVKLLINAGANVNGQNLEEGLRLISFPKSIP